MAFDARDATRLERASGKDSANEALEALMADGYAGNDLTDAALGEEGQRVRQRRQRQNRLRSKH